MTTAWETASLAALAAWIYLLFARGGFWRSGERLVPRGAGLDAWPEVVAVIPARNEADVIGRSIASVLAQDYPGELSVVVVDDGSDDGTSSVARAAGAATTRRLDIVQGLPLPNGWVGKMWAVAQGVRRAAGTAPNASFVWLTDADIDHAPDELRCLTTKAQAETLDLVSLMVRLHCRTAFERLLIPSFVFFFQKLYPFAWANQPTFRTAAAAGGSMLLRRTALERIGGIESIKAELIDDCALAARVKAGGAIWVGLSESTRSLRPYDGLRGIWLMVARTAFRQLECSWPLLVLTVIVLAIVYAAPPIVIIAAPFHGSLVALLAAIAAYALMARAFAPTLRLYGIGPLAGLLLPVSAVLYSLMTIDSARRHWVGKGGGWKARNYAHRRGRIV
jgi:hopene-associated glycosyltransferase HpnB